MIYVVGGMAAFSRWCRDQNVGIGRHDVRLVTTLEQARGKRLHKEDEIIKLGDADAHVARQLEGSRLSPS